MHIDVEMLRDFYASPLGQVVRRLIAGRIRSRWRNTVNETLIGLGYAAPYLGAFSSEAKRIGALMPGQQGALVWPREGCKRSVLIEEEALPLPDNSVDRLLVVHGLEMADRVPPVLREMWRVLAPEGSLLMIVPNRRGLWARTDRTPFGYGRPYSRGQVETMLKDALFTPVEWGEALYLPPFSRDMLLRSAVAWERMGARLTPGFAGVIIVEASKQVVAPIGKVKKVRILRDLMPVPGHLAGVKRSDEICPDHVPKRPLGNGR